MKKMILTVLAAGLLMVGICGTSSATTFTSTTDLTNLGFYGALTGTGTVSWTQAMPFDFQIPYDTVNSATLKIYTNYVNGNNDRIFVESSYVGNLLNDKGWSWCTNPLEKSVFNIAPFITAPWATGAPVDITLKYNENFFTAGILYLDRSVLTLDYNNVAAPVPEPGTIVLLGAGLLGLGFYGRRRVQK